MYISKETKVNDMASRYDGYFLILKLDYHKQESNDDTIDPSLKNKFQYWNKNLEKGKKQQRYRQYKSMKMDIANTV